MEDKKNIKSYVIMIILLVLIVIGFIVIVNYKNSQLEYEEYLKDYKINEYIPMYVSDESMARIYLNEFTNLMSMDINKAYNLLDEDYRNTKFGNLDSFTNYVNSFENKNFVLSKYYKTTKDQYLIFGVYDTNGNLFIFKTNGVKQYSVYLDDYTVEIG